MRKEITVTANMVGRKIKYILSGDLGLSGNVIKKLKASGGIFVNGENVHVDRVLVADDVLELVFPDERSENIESEDIMLDIIYEDSDIIAINKPSGMPSHPSKEHYSGTLANAVMHYFKNDFTFRIITRLDKDTSGVVLIAKNALSAQKLNDEMKNRKFEKEYVAVVCGSLNEKEGIIDAPISRAEGIKRTVADVGYEAITKYKVEKETDELSLVRLNPLTGRTHQIRVHLAYIGTPIYGDWLYGKEITGERVRLHCAKIKFYHPSTGKEITLEAPLPEDIISLIK